MANRRPTRPSAIGDLVLANWANWSPSEFDEWGAGWGVGVVVGLDGLDFGMVDVRWLGGREYRSTRELIWIGGSTC